MNCDWIEAHLSAYVDHELSQNERDLIEHHLGTCTHCQQVQNEFLDMTSMMKNEFDNLMAPVDIENKVMMTIALSHQETQARRFSILYLVSASVCFAGITFLIASPFGMFLRAILRLMVAITRGGIELSTSIGFPGISMFIAFCVVLAGLSLVGVVHLLRTAQSEAMS